MREVTLVFASHHTQAGSTQLMGCTLCIIKTAILLQHLCVSQISFFSSVVVLFVGLLGPHGVLVLRDCGQRRSRHAGRLHNLDVLTCQTRHQLLTRRTARKEELVGHSCQYGTEHGPDPVHLKAGKGEVS